MRVLNKHNYTSSGSLYELTIKSAIFNKHLVKISSPGVSLSRDRGESSLGLKYLKNLLDRLDI